MILIDKDGTMYIYQGDSGEVVITGFDSDVKATVYFAIQDEDRNLVGEELQVAVNNSDTVTIVLTSEFTDLLTVPKNKPYQMYYYGIKACHQDGLTEDTLFVENGTYGDMNPIIVYPKKVKGV